MFKVHYVIFILLTFSFKSIVVLNVRKMRFLSNKCVFLNPTPVKHNPSEDSKVIRPRTSCWKCNWLDIISRDRKRNNFEALIPSPKLTIPIWVQGYSGENRTKSGPPLSLYIETHKTLFYFARHCPSVSSCTIRDRYLLLVQRRTSWIWHYSRKCLYIYYCRISSWEFDAWRSILNLL